MKLHILLAVVVTVVLCDDSTYDSGYDNFNIDDIISSTRLMRSYLKCFLGEGKCSPDANVFKKWIPEVVESSCGKCSENQKVLVAKVMRAVKENLSEDFNRLYNKHDPDNKRRQELEEFIEKYGQSN